MEDGVVTIGTKLDTKGFDLEIKATKDKLDGLIEEYKVLEKAKPFEGQDKELKKLQEEIEKTRNKYVDLNAKQKKIDSASMFGMKNSIENIGNSIEKVTKRVTHWALAIFGVRTAYNMIRNAMSTITSQDEQLQADVDYMKNAIAYTLEPVVRGIVNLMKQLMYYVAYIVKAWTGKNIFANANKSLKSATSSAKQLNKELNKTIAGFDEMNVLQDTSSRGSTADGGAIPSFDLTNLEDMPIPSWLQWIADNKDIVIAGLTGIAAGLLAVKLGATGIMGLGIGIAVAGVILLIKDIIKFIKDPSWTNFIAILGDIAIAIGGIMLIMGNWWGLLIAIIGLLVKLVAENWDKIKEILSKVASWFYDHIISPIGNFFKEEGARIKETFKNTIEDVKSRFNSMVNFFKNIISKITNLFKTIGTNVGNVIGSAFKAVINGVLKAIENILNFPIKSINKLINTINKVPGINLGTLQTFSLPRLARGGIVNNPGPGVMMGSYVAGEKGPEAVIPLDDQTLDRLGLAFARHTTINATLINQMNGRVISRELQKVQNDSDFAYNR